MMKIDEFKNLTDTHSADLSRWPKEKIHAAQVLIAHNEDARKYFDEALLLDDILRRCDIIGTKSSSLLEAKILGKISSMRQEEPSFFGFFNPAALFAPSSGLLAAALIGFIMGFSPPSVQDQNLTDPFYAEQVAENDTIVDEGEIF